MGRLLLQIFGIKEGNPGKIPGFLPYDIQVDPPGLEPGLCGTKIRRVANYTMGQGIIELQN